MPENKQNVILRSDVHVELIDSMGGDHRAVQSARVSTKGADSLNLLTGGEGLINYLMRDKHEVPFEHTVFTFYIEAPIFVTRQLLKHRISSISEESGRYKELKPVFYTEPRERHLTQIGKTGDYTFVDGGDDLYAFNLEEDRLAALDAWDRYQRKLQAGIAKESARKNLPVNLFSSMYITLNARSLMNVMSLRTSDAGSHPQYEIEAVARQMETIWAEHSPVTYAAFRKHVMGDE